MRVRVSRKKINKVRKKSRVIPEVAKNRRVGVQASLSKKKKAARVSSLKKKMATKPISPKRIHAQGKLIVQVMYPDKTQKVSEQNIRITPFVSEPAKVGVSYGVTLNMTNYQSARATVWCELPCYPEEKEAALQVAQSIVAAEIGREIKSLDNQRKKHGWVSAVIKPDEDLITFLRDGVHYQ